MYTNIIEKLYFDIFVIVLKDGNGVWKIQKNNIKNRLALHQNNMLTAVFLRMSCVIGVIIGRYNECTPLNRFHVIAYYYYYYLLLRFPKSNSLSAASSEVL